MQLTAQGQLSIRAASVRRVHPYDDPSSNRCIRRPWMHPQYGTPAHSPKAPRRSSCPPSTRGRTRSGNEESEKGAEEVEDNVLASCLSFLCSHPTPRLCDEPPGSLLLRFEGAGRTTGLDGVAGEWMRAGAGSRARETMQTSLVLCSPPPFFMCTTSRWARCVGIISEVKVVGHCSGYWF